MYKLCLILFFFYYSFNLWAKLPEEPTGALVEVVYPRDMDENGYYPLGKGIDSTFLLGNVRYPLHTRLTINQQKIPIDSGGGWLAWVKCPSKNKDFTWRVQAIVDTDTMILQLPVKRISTIREFQKEVTLTNPFWVETLENARLQVQPGGKNFLLPLEKTQLKIIKSKGNYWGTNSYKPQLLWINKSQVEKITVYQSLSLSQIFFVTDSQNNQLRVKYFINSPPLFQFQSDSNMNHSILFSMFCDSVDRSIQQGFQDRYFEVLVNVNNRKIDFRCASRLGTKFTGYSLFKDSTFVEMVLKFSPLISTQNDTLPLLGWKIAIDPGHGGEQYGAIGPTWLSEKKVNLQVSNLLRKKLCTLGATVIQTRTDDSDISLSQRIRIADSASAHMFVSVHQNALPDGENPWFQTGTSTYYFHPFSYLVASQVHQSLLDKLDLTERGLYVGDFAVVRYAGALSILTEASFIIRPDHERKLKDPYFLFAQADAIASGIVTYVKSK